MAISSSQQEVLKVVIGLFNVAPGKANFDALSSLLEGDNAMTPLQIAEALDDIPLFVDSIMGSATTTAAQVNVLMSHFGLSTAGDLNPNSAASVAHTYFTDRIENGDSFGSIVYDAVVFLSGSVATEFAATAALLSNKAAVAEYWSVTKGLSASTLEELQQVLSKVTATTDVSTPEALDAVIAQATDNVAPTATAADFSFAENATTATVLGTVAAADNVAVIGFEISSGNDSGFFAIDAAGKITLTDAGVASAANDFETAPNSFTIGVKAVDTAGNKSEAVDVVVNVTDVDDVAPALAGTNPIVLSGSNVLINFDEAINSSKLPSATDFVVIAGGSTTVTVNTVSISGSTVTLGLATAPSGEVKVSYTPNADVNKQLQDAAGNKSASIDSKVAVVDNTAPTLTSSTPSDNATSVAIADNIVLNFSETVKAGSGNIVITNTGDSSDTRTIDVSSSQVTISGSTVTVNPTADLKAGASYVVTMGSGVIKDVAGNNFAGVSGSNLDFSTAGAAGTGQTFTLTTSVDSIPGLTGSKGTTDNSGGDTIIGEVSTTTTNTVNAADQINGGDGSDIYKIFGTFTQSTSNTGVITNTETLYIDKFADAAQNLTSLAKSATGIEKIQVGDASLLGTGGARTITTTAGQSLSLATGAANTHTVDAVTWAASTTDTSLNLTLNGYQGGDAATAPKNLTITGAAATALNIASTGNVNKVATFTGPATVTSHTITGDKALTYALAAADAAALSGINAEAASGDISVDASAATVKSSFTFKGGSGNDAVTLANDALGTLTAGTQIAMGTGAADKLGIKDIALTTTEFGRINAATGVEVLGLNANITLDASQLTSIKQFSVDTTALTQTINNLSTGSVVTLNAAAPTALTLTGALGVTDATVNLSTSTTASSMTVGTLTATGLTNLTLTSNSKGSTVTNTITTLANADNSSIKISGSADLTITNALAATTTGSSVDASSLSGKLSIVGSTKNDAIKGGSGNDTIQGATAGTDNQGDTLTGNGGSDTFQFVEAFDTDAATTMAAALKQSAGTTAVVKITDFVVGTDKIKFDSTGTDNAIGTSISLATAQTIASANDLTDVYNGISAIGASTAGGALSGVVLTITAGTLAGNKFLYVNDATGAVSTANDMLINITGVSGTLAGTDFTFG